MLQNFIAGQTISTETFIISVCFRNVCQYWSMKNICQYRNTRNIVIAIIFYFQEANYSTQLGITITYVSNIFCNTWVLVNNLLENITWICSCLNWYTLSPVTCLEQPFMLCKHKYLMDYKAIYSRDAVNYINIIFPFFNSKIKDSTFVKIKQEVSFSITD